jgi:hypothetical protein
MRFVIPEAAPRPSGTQGHGPGVNFWLLGPGSAFGRPG